MTEYSFPIPEAAMNVDGWSSVTKGIGNGIIDQGGFPYRLTSLSNVNNTGVIKCPTNATTRDQFGQAILEGFYHRYDADITLSFPAVSKTTTYYVVLFYDPSNTTLPVTLKVVTSLDYTQGRNYLHLYNVTRQPNQLLTDATVRMIRPRVAPVLVVTSKDDLPRAQKSLWGTLAIVHNGRAGNNAALYMAMTGDDAESVDGWYWKAIYDPALDDKTYAWEIRADTGTYGSAGAGYTRAIGRRGKRRAFRGRVARVVDGANFQVREDAYQIWSGNLDPGDRPAARQVFVTGTSSRSGGGFATVELYSTGEVYAWVTKSSSYISLDGIEWEVS